MTERPRNVAHVESLIEKSDFSYPGSTETFGYGAPLGKTFGLKRVGVNYEILPPGHRSSWPHAHKVEDELVFVLEGHPTLWQNGEVTQLNPGDSVGWPGGTGLAHCLINDTDHEVKYIVMGENLDGEQLNYPKHPARNKSIDEKGWHWKDGPEHKLGPHDGFPQNSPHKSEDCQRNP